MASHAADIVLLCDDWMLVPDAVTPAIAGQVPPVFAAAAHTIPDLGVPANSARLIREPRGWRRRGEGAS